MHPVIGGTCRALMAAACLGVLADAQAPASRGNDKTCVLVAATVMAFGQYDPVDTAPLDVQGKILYKCGHEGKAARSTRTSGPQPTDSSDKLIVQISLGTGMSGRFAREMRGSNDSLRYNLYLDSLRTQIWGDGTAGTEVYTANAQPNGKTVIVPVFGRVFPGQDVADGIYLDSLVVTLDF